MLKVFEDISLDKKRLKYFSLPKYYISVRQSVAESFAKIM